MAEDINKKLEEKRTEYFSNWEIDYRRTKEEIDRIILNLEFIKTNSDPVFQDLTIKFFTIHLANFFYFHIRKKLVDLNREKDIEKLLLTGFSNDSFLPPPNLMNQYLSYLGFENKKIQNYQDDYKKLNNVRNKYAHGATNQTNLSITIDEYKEMYKQILLI